MSESALRTELFVDGRGNHIEVHERTQDCLDHGCCIHNPTDHHMRDWPLVWHGFWRRMDRLCEHGHPHPDPDGRAFEMRWARQRGATLSIELGIHSCDGCCRVPE